MRNFRIVLTPPDSLNNSWSVFNKKFVQTICANPLFNKDDHIFTLGSCFAVEIRKALKHAGVDVYPRLVDLALDQQRYLIGDLPERENFNFYNTFSIEQEFSKALGLWEQSPDDYWQVQDQWWNTGELVYQDPYRRCVFARTHEDIINVTQAIDEVVKQGVLSADGFFITLGLIEVWKKRNNQKVACINPGYNGGGGSSETEFHLSNYQENLSNLQRVVEHIRHINPCARIVFTVSPVPLGSTFTDNDVFVANMESKSLLRTAAAEVCRNNEDVHYFQSYDICGAIRNVYEPDGRHVRPEVVKMIIDGFMASFFSQV